MAAAAIENHKMTISSSALASLFSVLFGINAVAIKVGLRGIGPLTSAGIRFGIAAVIIAVFSIITGRVLRVSRKQFFLLVINTVIFLFQLTCYYQGLSRSSASRATIIINLEPFLVLILAHFFIEGERINLRKVAGLAMGFAGVIIIFLDGLTLEGGIRTGDLILSTGTLLWASSTIYVKRIIHDFNPYQMVFYPMAMAAPVFIVMGHFFDASMVHYINGPILLAMFHQGVVTAAAGFVIWNFLIKKHGVVALNSFIFLVPIAGVFSGWLILGEDISANIALSLGLIVMGIFVLNYFDSPRFFHPEKN